uniref:uncharacterized protein LOC105350503 isoform X1 n=1 Tax=Fragaria vesca subsp. vesca TaxID=101020 RepID=UPI0005CA65C3|nr:PREDICTED: uncharacterized protein LOC105350503 isoform X1 [Fragaria vesca subsp. vesca]
MKLLSSSESSPFSSFSSCSSSTITTTTTTFDLTNSKGATNGCIAGILRRILCYGSLPTYPSDHIPEESNSVDKSRHDRHFKSKEKAEETESSATPSLVARLMGLESVPAATLLSISNSISRSRSLNSVDRLSGDHDPIQAHERRRVKSLREMPTFIESEEFLVLSFENGSERKERRSKGRKCETGHGELRKKEAGKSRNKENRKERGLQKEKQQVQEEKSTRVLKDLNGREMQRSKTSHKPKKETICDVLNNVESDCTSEDLSPVSVLDYGQLLVDNEAPTSEEGAVLASSFPRRKEDCLTCDARKTKNIEGKGLATMKKEYRTEEYFAILDEICSLTEAELVGSNWSVHKGIWNNHEGFAGIVADFESQILGQLIEELVDQLADFPTRNSKPVRFTTIVNLVLL